MNIRKLPYVCTSLALSVALSACGDDGSSADELGDADTTQESESNGESESESDGETDSGSEGETDTGNPEDYATVTHTFPDVSLAPFEEVDNCVQWTLENEETVYVQAVTLSNLGYFHHSNWFVIPEDMFEGEDGFFSCGSRGFSELGAAAAGSVLFAQSTQSFVEVQRTGDGAVIKVPPHHKIVATTHMLNVGPSPVETMLFMSLDIIHPKLVDVVLAPFRLSYVDIDIPASSKSRFTGLCDSFGAQYAAAAGVPLDMKLHYVLPHYHYLGDFFDLTLEGGPLDGESIYELNGFTGEANGKVFDPPLDLTGVEGLRFTCGYDNWRDVNVGWGIGDQEMCVMLGLAESKVLMDSSVIKDTVAVGMNDGIFEFEGTCNYFALPISASQGPPTDAEREGELYIPPTGEEGVPPVPECIDHDPTVAPIVEPTLSNVAAVVFQQSCTFNACHGSSGAAGGLDLQTPNLIAELLDHEVVGNPGATLVEPGDPDSSWLFEIMSSCAPEGGSGSHMPLNAPVLLSDSSLALVREWIAGGALDN